MTNELDFGIALARQAGTMMKHAIGIGMKKDWKPGSSVVTETDIAINGLVIEKIRTAFPDHAVLGEEISLKVDGSTFTWVCDPVDGTLPFSRGIPISTFSLALVENGVPILGVIFDPFSDRLFTAETGSGTYLNGQPVRVSTTATLDRAHIDIEGKVVVGMMEPMLDAGAKVTKFYCITCPGVLVTCGEFDAAIFSGGYAWDVAALKILVEEAGGKVTDIEGNEQRYDQKLNGGIVSNGLLNATLLPLAKAAIKAYSISHQ